MPLLHVLQHRGRIKSAGAFRHPAAEEQLGAALDRLLHLPVQRRPQIVARLRADLGVAVKRVAHGCATASPRQKSPRNALRHFLDDDEALRSDTALPAVDQARIRRRLRRLLNVGVFQDDERVASAELEHGLLDLAARLLGHFAAGAIAAGQRDRADARIGE